jgi:hypothetical protein
MHDNKKSSGIYIQPIGGLCNRMRAIDSAICLAQATNSDLHVLWYMNFELNCRFEDLWHIPPGIATIVEIQTKTKVDELLQKFYRRKIGGFVYNFYCKYFSGDFDLVLPYSQMELYNRHDYIDCDFKEIVAGKRVSIVTPDRFYGDDRLLHNFVPIDSLDRIINDLVVNFSSVVGVHIRRTDNENSKKYSSTAKFVEFMSAEIETDDRTKFFVATDSIEEEENLKTIFPDRIITYPKKSLDRNDPIAIQSALIDLYCLSKCRKLLGSYWSSFSYTAHQMHNIEYVVVK